MIVHELKKRGVDAERIVREDIDVSLSERCRRVNDIYRDTKRNAILVSVHCNAAGNRDWMHRIF